MDNNEYLIGRNAVKEAIISNREIDTIYFNKESKGAKLTDILTLAKDNKIRFKYVTKAKLDEMSKNGHHQGVAARISPYKYSDVDDILNNARDKNEDPFIFILDGIEDPHNLGAIIRTCNQVGGHGVIIKKDRSTHVTGTVISASAGAINYVPVAMVTNITKTIEKLQDDGLWIVGCDMSGDIMYDVNLTGPIAIVIGNEGSGISRLVRENCDIIATIPMKGDIDSLNASVAAGVVSYEIFRQREMKLRNSN